jgi:hypothetical protein
MKIEEMQAKKDKYGLFEDPKTMELIGFTKFEILNSLCKRKTDEINEVSQTRQLIF